ncbi:hypothetical protein ACFQ10_00685 [Streptomyces indonesiensis]
MSTGMRRRAATTAVTLAMGGTLAFGLMTPAASAANGPCYDGRCKTTVSAPKTITVDSRTFGFGKLKITSVSSRSVKMSAAAAPQRQHQPGRHRQVQQPEDLGEVGLRQ